MSHKTGLISGFFWKLLERFSVSGIHFVLQIVLARMLDPEHYGILTIMLIFTNIANAFIQEGFHTALVQNKDVTEEDYSSVLWLSLGIAAIMYCIVFVTAPLIGDFYDMPGIERPLRVLALMLFPGALNSVQLAKVTREMDFKKVFYSNIGGALISGGIGIAIAYMGGGLWALVVKNLLDIVVVCVVMCFTVQLKLRFTFNFKRIKVLFSYGWKLLVSSLLETLFNNLSNLLIGKKYNSETLGYYDRGSQFPDFVINALNQAVETVMLPAMAAEQDEQKRVKSLMHNSLTLSTYLIFPMMAGLAAVAEPLVRLVLTEKWMPCVPYVQICCCILVLFPVHSCNLQAINAVGRSDIFLKLEIIKKIVGIPILIIAVFFFDSPLAIAASELIVVWLYWFINAYPNKKLVNYPVWEQIVDVMPVLVLSLIMCGSVLLIGNYCMNAALPDIVTLVIQVLTGVAVYLLLSVIFKPYPYRMALEIAGDFLKKK